MTAGVVRKKRGVDPPQDDGDAPELFPHEVRHGLDARIPIGHRARQKNGVRGRDSVEFLKKPGDWDAIARIAAGDVFKDRGLGDLFLMERAAPVGLPAGFFSGLRTAAIEAVYEMNLDPAVPSHDLGQIEESKGFQPKIVGCKIVNPGIDEEDVLRRGHG